MSAIDLEIARFCDSMASLREMDCRLREAASPLPGMGNEGRHTDKDRRDRGQPPQQPHTVRQEARPREQDPLAGLVQGREEVSAAEERPAIHEG